VWPANLARPIQSKENLLKNQPNTNLINVRCSTCGTSFQLRSTAEGFAVDVCSNCHRAYTGRERSLSTGGRVERFNRRRALASA
jgi:large subunit ribosomal protein L31